MDTLSYLELLKELKIYLNTYFLKNKNISYTSFSLIGISEFSGEYKIQLNINNYSLGDKNKTENISGNIKMTYDEFQMFYRIIKIKKIKKCIE